MKKSNKGVFLRIVVQNTLLVILLLGTVGVASAGIVFDGSPGTAAPPPTLGPYTMTQFGPDPQPVPTEVSSVPSPFGILGFTGPVDHLKVGLGWATWSHGYTGDVYWTRTNTSLTLTMPPDTGAFYFYAEPTLYQTFSITATADDGTTSGPIPVEGFAGAQYFGFYGTSGSNIVSIDVTSSSDFAVGEFGIASPPTDIPEFASVAIPVASILGLLFLFNHRKRRTED
jgi:hypothetical protein